MPPPSVPRLSSKLVAWDRSVQSAVGPVIGWALGDRVTFRGTMKLLRTLLLHVALAVAWVLIVVGCLVAWTLCAAFGWLPRG